MGLDFAIDALYETRWTPADAADACKTHNGKAYPSEEFIKDFFQKSGFEFVVRHIQLFDCYRAEWRQQRSGEAGGAVVGQTPQEAAVYAMSQLLKHRESPANGVATA